MMSNAKDIQVDTAHLNFLIYGKSGTGKTTFGCCFPRPFVFDFDGGMLSQKGKDVEYIKFKSYQEFEIKLREFEQKCEFDTVILDSVTTMQEYMMDKILAANRKKIPTLHEWNILITELKDLFMRLTNMANNVVVIAHEQMLQDELLGSLLILPLIVGKKMPAQLPLWFDEVYRFQTVRDAKGLPVYQFMTMSDIQYMAKSRLNCLEPVEDWSKDGKAINAFELIMSRIKKGG